MIVSGVQIVGGPDYCQLQAQVVMDTLGRKSFLLWYRFPLELKSFINASAGDPFLAALLLPAMASGEDLKIEAPVSPKLFKAVSTIQDIYRCWNKSLQQITIEAPAKGEEVNRETRPLVAASFFSGGVDSFYTLSKHIDKELKQEDESDIIKYLILVHGFDIRIAEENNTIFQEALSNVQTVGNTLGKKVLPIATNIREFIDLFVNWGSLGHGPSMASVGLTLQSLFHKIYIAGSYSYGHLSPWGSHPLLDPLWSTESLSFMYDGGEASRFEKICAVAKLPIASKTLRVCYQLNGAAGTVQLNCGRCRKCLTVMLALHLAKVLTKSEVFPRTIDLDLVRRMHISGNHPVIKDIYQALDSSKEDHQAIKLAMEAAFVRAGIDIEMYKQPEKPEETFLLKEIYHLNQELSDLLPATETVILVDEDQLGIGSIHACRAVPFVEKDGKYRGPPADDETAIKEVHRLQQQGAGYMVIAWTAFWWLQHYKEFTKYLRFNFPCIVENDRLVIFSLKSLKMNTHESF